MRTQVELAEKERDFMSGGFRAVGAMHRIPGQVLGEIGADGAGRGFFRIGGAHDFAIPGDGVFSFQHLDHHRAGRHIVNEFFVEGAFAVDGVKNFGLLASQTDHLGRDNLQAPVLETAVNLADDVASDGVGLDDRQGVFQDHAGLHGAKSGWLQSAPVSCAGLARIRRRRAGRGIGV